MARTKKKTRRRIPQPVWEKIGEVGVDSGQLMICDPTYVDGQWIPNQPPTGHPVMVLTKKGRERFPDAKNFSYRWPFEWGNYGDVCPAIGMSINEARDEGLVVEADLDPVREFSYRGCCDVSRQAGENFGQLNYELGHAGVAVAFSSGYGDGCYEVFARRNEEGRIAEVRIALITEKEEEMWRKLTGQDE